MYFDTSSKTSRRDYSDLSSLGDCLVPSRNFFFLHQFSLRRRVEIEDMEESDGVSSTQTAVGSDTAEEERAIRAMPFVTTLSFVRAVKGKAEGWWVTLT